MLLSTVVDTSNVVAATAARNAKVATLAEVLRAAQPSEIAPLTCWLAGELTQRQIGVGWALFRELPAPSDSSSFTVSEVERELSAIGLLGGPGSAGARREAIGRLLARATATEQQFLVALLSGELRHGALAGVMAEAIAKAAAVPATTVRRASMLAGDLAAVAQIALAEGRPGLEAVRLAIGRPIAPMLAGSADSVAEAITKITPALIDVKLDGVRIQVHRQGDEIELFTRSLDRVGQRLPEVVETVRALPARSLVLDGEVIALREDGRPQPFQVTAARFGRHGPRTEKLTAFFFDLLHLDGKDLLDSPLQERSDALSKLLAADQLVQRTVATDLEAAERAFAAAIAAGHEGVVVKALDAPYAAGRRGAAWLKVKPVHTLDLVVLAAEWGHGRRRGWLSNLHLGARDGDGWAMIGKTFKGLTDAMLEWQTGRLLELETARAGIAVQVRPELVVEIAFDGVQRSPRYRSGMALRFARVKRYRDDKNAAQVDSAETVRSFLGSTKD